MITTLSIDHFYKAQFGEDRILWQVFRHQTCGFFIEVGAFDGVTLSNTFFLEQMGWRGLLIEPIGPLAQKAAVARPRSCVIQAACSTKGSCGTAKFTVAQNVPVLSFLKSDQDHIDRCIREGAQLVEIDVPVRSLDDIMQEQRKNPTSMGNAWTEGGGWNVDLVSIDTEGNEQQVLEGFDLERIKPRVLVIENDRPSGEPIEAYLDGRGYRKFHRQTINDFYVRKDIEDGELLLDNFS